MATWDHSNSAKIWERKAVNSLSGLLREIAEVTDFNTAMEIAREKGGRKASISVRPSPRSWLSRLVGIEKAAIIGRALNGGRGGMDYLIPMGPGPLMQRKSAILSMSLDGASKPAISKALGIHVRTVQLYRMRLRDEGVIFPCDKNQSGAKRG